MHAYMYPEEFAHVWKSWGLACIAQKNVGVYIVCYSCTCYKFWLQQRHFSRVQSVCTVNNLICYTLCGKPQKPHLKRALAVNSSTCVSTAFKRWKPSEQPLGSQILGSGHEPQSRDHRIWRVCRLYSLCFLGLSKAEVSQKQSSY